MNESKSRPLYTLEAAWFIVLQHGGYNTISAFLWTRWPHWAALYMPRALQSSSPCPGHRTKCASFYPSSTIYIRVHTADKVMYLYMLPINPHQLHRTFISSQKHSSGQFDRWKATGTILDRPTTPPSAGEFDATPFACDSGGTILYSIRSSTPAQGHLEVRFDMLCYPWSETSMGLTINRFPLDLN